MIPQILKLQPNEMHISYICRLAEVNGYSNIMHFLNTYVQDPETAKLYARKSADGLLDVRNDCYFLMDSLGIDEPNAALRYIRSTSMLPGLLPLMSQITGAHYVGFLSEYRNPSRLSSHRDLPVPHLQYCPVCMAESKYYRRHHQMPGVTCCYLHGCRLHTFGGKSRLAMSDDLDKTVIPATEEEIQYAAFCNDFLRSGLNTSLNQLVPLIRREMGNHGYASPSDTAFIDGMSRYQTISTYKPSQFHLERKYLDNLDTIDVLKALLVLFQTAKSVKESVVADIELQSQFYAKIDGTYQMKSPYAEDIVELRCCKCGQKFIAAPARIAAGFGCPDCDRKLGDRAVFRRIVDCIGRGEYQLNSEFDGMGNPVRITHVKCGYDYKIQPNAFIGGERCQCIRKIPLDEVKAKIERSGEYKLIQYKDTNTPMLIQHVKCGGTFSYLYNAFLHDPWCRCCEHRDTMARFHKSGKDFCDEVRQLTGDDYTVVGEYKSCDTPIEIRHNLCGRIMRVNPTHFRHGQRCSACRHLLSKSQFADYVRAVSNGEYECVKYVSTHAVTLRHATDGKTVTTTANWALQELSRPTPSEMLPLSCTKGEYVFKPTQIDLVWNWLVAHCQPDDSFSYKDCRIDELNYEVVKCAVNRMAKAADGRLERVRGGVYKFTDIGKYIIARTKGTI